MNKNGEIYTAGKNFTLSPAVTAVTNFTSVPAIQKFSSQPATFQTIRKFPNRLEIFRTIWKLFRQSSNFSDHPETFQTIHTVSRPSSNFPDHSETFQCIFKGYAQKLFKYAKAYIPVKSAEMMVSCRRTSGLQVEVEEKQLENFRP